MSGTATDEWVRRVLGVAVVPPGGSARTEAAFRADFGKAVGAWMAASEAVDGQINALRKFLLATNDPGLHKIADAGLNGITGTRKVALAKALQEVGAAKGEAVATAAARAAEAAAAFRSFAEADPRIAACDACPELPISIAATLGRGLTALEQALTRR